MKESPRGSARSRLLKDIGLQAVGNYVSTALRVVRGFVVAGLLGPAQMGIVSMGSLLMNYSAYADFGLTQGLNREIPMSLGHGDDSAAQSWVWYGIVGRLVSGAVVCVLVVVWVLSPWGQSQPVAVRWVLVLAAVASLFSGQVLVFQVVAKGMSDFVSSSRIIVVLAVLNLILGILGAVWIGPIGVMAGVAVACAFTAAYGWSRVKPSSYDGIRRPQLIQLARVGIPLALLTFMGFNLENIDQVVILWFMDREALGLYAVVLQAGGLMSLIGLSVSNAVGPRLLRAYAVKGEMKDIEHLTWLPAKALSAVLPIAVCAAWLIGPSVVHWLLPEYVSVIAPFRIYMAAMCFLGINLGVSTTLLALNRHTLNVPIILMSIGLNIVVDVVLVGHFGLGLVGVATGSLITYFVYWTMHTGLVQWYFERDLMVVLAKNLRLGWPAMMVVGFLGVSNLIGELDSGWTVANGVFLMAAICAGFIQGKSLLPMLKGGLAR